MIRRGIYALVAFGSGFAALLYQLAWQRELHSVYGTASEATAVIVSTFMLGLGFGAALGGLYAQREGARLLLGFACCELAIGIYGAASLAIGRAAAAWLGPGGLLAAGAGSAMLLLVPTTCMGASLPLLATYALRYDGLPGKAVARFYFVNTLGAAASSVACVVLLFGALGLSGTVRLAAAVNLAVGLGALLLGRAR